jgi:hypothetical protein
VNLSIIKQEFFFPASTKQNGLKTNLVKNSVERNFVARTGCVFLRSTLWRFSRFVSKFHALRTPQGFPEIRRKLLKTLDIPQRALLATNLHFVTLHPTKDISLGGYQAYEFYENKTKFIHSIFFRLADVRRSPWGRDWGKCPVGNHYTAKSR